MVKIVNALPDLGACEALTTKMRLRRASVFSACEAIANVAPLDF